MKLQYDDPTTHEDLMGVDDTQGKVSYATGSLSTNL
jgi:hypothetical protein